MEYFLSFLVAMFATIALIPPLSLAYQRLGIFDQPNERKIHIEPIPRVGGVAIVPAAIIPLLFWLGTDSNLIGLFIGVACIFILGVIDDIKTLNYKPKLLMQVLAAASIFSFQLIDFSSVGLFGVSDQFVWLVAAVLFLFVIGVTNAINLSDGLDGLAGGEALLSLSVLALLALELQHSLVLFVVFAIMGAIFGFLRFNTYPAKIFMGDTGSQFLGYMLAICSVLLTYSETSAYAKTLPLLLVGLPIVDTLTVMVLRIREGKSPFEADRKHIHHRLLDKGLKHYQAVVAIYLIQSVYVLTAYFMRYSMESQVLFAFLALSMTVLAVVYFDFSYWASVLKVVNRFAESLRGLLRGVQSLSKPYLYYLLIALLMVYFVLSCIVSHDVNALEKVIAIIVFACALVLVTVMKQERTHWIDRTLLYLMVVLSISVNAQSDLSTGIIWTLEWLIFGAMGVLVLLSLLSTEDDRFVGTPLDFLVILIALIVPNLPAEPLLLENLRYMAIKLVVLFYVAEYVLANIRDRQVFMRLGTVFCAGLLVITTNL